MTFLRPFFLALLLLPLLALRFKKKGKGASIWEKMIAPELLPYLLVRSKTKTAKYFQVYKILLWCVLVIGLSGPAWFKIPLPSQQQDPATVLVLELGSTMIGENLEKAKQKINDLLDELSGEQVALVLYDKIGYTAAPLTFDKNIIRDMVPYLERGVLPNPNNIQPIAGFKKASSILSSAGIDKGRIIYISGGMDLKDVVQKWSKQNKNSVGILVIGSMEAHPVALPTCGFLKDDEGHLVMLKPDMQQLKQLGVVQLMTADRSDVQNIIDETAVEATTYHQRDDMMMWQDIGGWFVAICAPFFALLFRKKLMLLLLLFTLPAEAGLWLRPDQESYLRQKQGVQAYREQQYNKAEELFSSGFNPDDLYNWGNALAFQQKIKEAIDAYQQVLDEQPDHQDALFNKKYLEDKLKEQEDPPPPPPEEQTPPPPEDQTPPPENQTPPPEQEQTPPPEQEQTPPPEQEQTPPPEQEQTPPPEQEQTPPLEQEQTPPPEQEQTPPPEQEQTPPPEQGQTPPPEQEQTPPPEQEQTPPPEQEQTPSPEESEQSDLQSEQESPFDQQSQQILNQLPETPPSLLKYRLRRQYEKNR